MSKQERRILNLIRTAILPDKIYEIYGLVALSRDEWAASIRVKGSAEDRRFRYTQGRLYDEATIGDARVA